MFVGALNAGPEADEFTGAEVDCEVGSVAKELFEESDAGSPDPDGVPACKISVASVANLAAFAR